MTTQFHCVVRDTTHFDSLLSNDAIEQKVSSTPSVPGHVERSQA
jgi:hypothetical protein